jgi:hypothetical protein
LKDLEGESFVEDEAENNPQRKRLEVALEVVKDVIKTKLAEREAINKRHERAVERKRLLDAIALKKEAQLSQASLDELQTKLDALDAA